MKRVTQVLASIIAIAALLVTAFWGNNYLEKRNEAKITSDVIRTFNEYAAAIKAGDAATVNRLTTSINDSFPGSNDSDNIASADVSMDMEKARTESQSSAGSTRNIEFNRRALPFGKAPIEYQVHIESRLPSLQLGFHCSAEQAATCVRRLIVFLDASKALRVDSIVMIENTAEWRQIYEDGYKLRTPVVAAKPGQFWGLMP